MHEIVYLQFGNLSNFIGSHFWNTQDSYSFDDADWSISWSSRTEERNAERSGVGVGAGAGVGITEKPSTVYRPRVLIFDKRQNFGALQSTSLDVADNGIDSVDPLVNTWGGKLQVHAEPRIPTSEYLLQLDQDPDQESEKRNDDKDEDVEMHPPEASSIRYWSDFNHVYFSEQSIHPLPATTVSPNDSSSIDDVYSDVVTWDESVEAFKRYEVQAELMEGSFRTLVEECDSLQAFQTISHIPSYGGFTISLLEQLADEYPKVTKVDFDILGSFEDGRGVLSPKKSSQMILSNARFLHQVASKDLSLSDLSIPLLSPTMWRPGRWRERIQVETGSMYHTSAVYAAHIESVTWPARQLETDVGRRGLDTLARTLNGSGTMPFSCLSGLFPLNEDDESDYTMELTLPAARSSDGSDEEIVAEWSVIRRSSPVDSSSRKTEASLIDSGGLGGLGASSVARQVIRESKGKGYPLALSHPQFFGHDGTLTSVGIYSSLSVRAGFSRVLDKHVEKCKRLMGVGGDGMGLGMEVDEMREVVEGLRTCASVYLQSE